MYPPIESVLAKRYLAGMILRGVVLVLFILAAIPLVQLVLQVSAEAADPLVRAGRRRPQTPLELIFQFVPAVMQYVLPAVALLLLQHRIVRWLAPLPRPRCPECGYWIRKGGSPKCPECGSALPRALVRDESEVDA